MERSETAPDRRHACQAQQGRAAERGTVSAALSVVAGVSPVTHRECGAPHLGGDGSVAEVLCCSCAEVLMPREHQHLAAHQHQLSAAHRTVKRQSHHQPTSLRVTPLYTALDYPSAQHHSTNCQSDFLPSDAPRPRHISNPCLGPTGASPRDT